MTYRISYGKFRRETNHYEIRIKEPIDPGWAALFEGMTVSMAENGETIIYASVVDKSALHGLLAMIGELNLTLISVVQLKSLNPFIGGNHEK